MQSIYSMPTRIVHGAGVLDGVGQACADLGVRRLLVVTDRNIAPQPFFARAMAALERAGILVTRYDGCGIDAHLSEVDEQAELARAKMIEGVLAIGGGSVMCVGKAIAIVARNPPSFRNCAGVAGFTIKSLPMIMVPTTAGSGAEVSQFTLVKDDERSTKFVGGGPLSFPDVAFLDPEVLLALPARTAAIAAVDAVSHAVEALFTQFATPLTDGLALNAVEMLVGAIPDAIATRAADACHANLLGSAIANMACGNARLGLAHALSLPLESKFDLPHGIGVGVLLPHVITFNAPAAPRKLVLLAKALGLDRSGERTGELVTRVVSRLYELYDAIGFPRRFDGLLDRSVSLRALSEAAVPGLYGTPAALPITSSTMIASPNIRQASVEDAIAIYEACFSPSIAAHG